MSGGYGGASTSVSLDINALDQLVNQNTNIGTSLGEITIGSEDVPLPIHTKVVAIDEAMADSFWEDNERTVMHQKRMHLKKALTDYTANKQAHVNEGKSK